MRRQLRTDDFFDVEPDAYAPTILLYCSCHGGLKRRRS